MKTPIQNSAGTWHRLHIGEGKTVPTDTVIGIFDMDTATVSPVTKKFLSGAQHRDDVINVSDELPKSFVVTDGTVYLSQLSPATLVQRAEHGSKYYANN